MLSLPPRQDLEVLIVSNCCSLFFLNYGCCFLIAFFLFNAADISLSQKLKEELKYEKESLETPSNAKPEFLKTFLDAGVWTVRTLFFFFVIPCLVYRL